MVRGDLVYYRINAEDGYIHGVVKGVNSANCTEEEYNHVRGIIESAPTAPDGFYYQLKENLEWELCEMPIIEEEAVETDYQSALEDLGVKFNA